MKKLLRYLLPYRRKMIASSLCMAVSVFCTLLLPTVMSQILDQGVYRAAEAEPPQLLEAVLPQCLLMLALALLSLGTVVLGYRLATRVTSSFARDLRNTLYARINAMHPEQIGQLGASALVTRMTHDVGTLVWVSNLMCGNIVIIPAMFVGGVVLCMRKDLLLSLVMLVMVPLVIGLVLLLSKKIAPLWETSDAYTERLNDLVRERIRGIRVIRAFVREPYEHTRIIRATERMSDNMIRANVTMELVAPIATFLLNLAVLGVVWLGALRLERGAGLTAGDIFAMIQYITIVLYSLISASWAILMLPHARVAARRIAEINDAEIRPEADAEAVRFSGAITLEHVSFRYEGADMPALRDVSLQIDAGQRIAIIGGTGAGKSTLVSLLLALRSPSEGRILFDGVDAAALSPKTVRANLSCALQSAMVYAGTIRENVRLGELTATDEEIARAVRIAQLEDFVASLDDGLEHRLDPSGTNLSGGQKQRLSLARALVREAPIYLFDDSFSALDFLTEARLRTALNTELAGKTQIVITQRAVSAMRSDRIFVLDQGVLVGAGTHRELLDSCAIYREIYESQTGGART